MPQRRGRNVTRGYGSFGSLKHASALLAVCFIGLAYQPDVPLESLIKDYAPRPSRFINVQGLQTHLRTEGNPSDPKLLLIHGTFSSLHTWDAVTERFTGPEAKNRFFVIRFDLPGFGLTGPHPNPDYRYTWQDYADFAKALLDALSVDKVSVAGNSLGGAISYTFAAKYPESVDKLILVDASPPFPRKTTPFVIKIARTPILGNILKYVTPQWLVRRSFNEVMGNPAKVTEPLIERTWRLQLRAGNRGAVLVRLSNTDDERSDWYREALKKIGAPTLIVWGSLDRWVEPSYANMLAEAIPDARVAMLPHLGHIPMEEDPDLFSETVSEFLS